MIGYALDHDFGIEQAGLIDLSIQRIFIDPLHLHIRIAEKIVKSVAKIFFDAKIKEKVGRKQIGHHGEIPPANLQRRPCQVS